MTINNETKITIGVAIAVVSGVSSFIYAMSSLATRQYVDTKTQDIKVEIKENKADTKDELKYIRNRVDQIFERVK